MKGVETSYTKGLLAETRAAMFLRMAGYKILETRFKTPLGEVDIVALKDKTLVFVEVKQRATEEEAAEAINLRNQRRVFAAAELYLQKYPDYNQYDLRFDALILSGGLKIQHIEAAWGH